VSLRAFAFFFLLSLTASADEPPPDCSVNRKCSSAGLECVAGDRNCADDARQRGLEVMCELGQGPRKRFVYCPPSTARTDSKGMWIMMVAAVAVAVIGGAALFLAMRMKRA
jgi:hypothetical protein